MSELPLDILVFIKGKDIREDTACDGFNSFEISALDAICQENAHVAVLGKCLIGRAGKLDRLLTNER